MKARRSVVTSVGVASQKAAAAGALPEEREDDDAEGDAAGVASASYDYLLSMPIHSLTHEKARPSTYSKTLVLAVHTVCQVVAQDEL